MSTTSNKFPSTKDNNGNTQYQMHTEVSLADCGEYGLTSSDKALLLAILADARWDGNKWESKLSIPVIQKRSGLGEKAQRSARKRLVELGLIKTYQQLDNSLIFHFRSLDANTTKVLEFNEALAKKKEAKTLHLKKVPENNALLKKYKKAWREAHPKRYESFKNAVMAKTRNGEIFDSNHHSEWRTTYTRNNPDDVMDLNLLDLDEGDSVVIGSGVKVINNGVEKPIVLKEETPTTTRTFDELAAKRLKATKDKDGLQGEEDLDFYGNDGVFTCEETIDKPIQCQEIIQGQENVQGVAKLPNDNLPKPDFDAAQYMRKHLLKYKPEGYQIHKRNLLDIGALGAMCNAITDYYIDHEGKDHGNSPDVVAGAVHAIYESRLFEDLNNLSILEKAKEHLEQQQTPF